MTVKAASMSVEAAVIARLDGDVDVQNHVIKDAQLEGGGAAGLEFVAADVVLVATLDPPDPGTRPVVLAGAGGALESEPSGLSIDGANTFAVPANMKVRGVADIGSDAFVGGSVVVGGTVMGSGAFV